MPRICFNENDFAFPPPEEADEEGLLLIGGKVTPERVIAAYKNGIFPWYNDESLPLWWTPDPRFVLFPDELHVSKSMQKLLNKEVFSFTINKSFDDVIACCATVHRKDPDGTWITDTMKNVYSQLHRQGIAISAETWKDGQLVGGLYGLQIGRLFCGESMFSKVPNASKYAFIKLVRHLAEKGISLIDCQVYTDHVATLGARLIDRNDYLRYTKALV